MAGEELRIVRGPGHRIGDRRMLRRVPGKEHGRDGNVADAGGAGTRFDFSHAGDHERWSYHNEELVRTSLAFGVNIRTADMGACGTGRKQNSKTNNPE